VELTFQQLQELLLVLQQTSITTFHLKSDAFELTLEQGQTGVISAVSPSVTPVVALGERPTPEAKETKKGIEVTSMMVGTFYAAPAPGEPPFVQVGDRVQLRTNPGHCGSDENHERNRGTRQRGNHRNWGGKWSTHRVWAGVDASAPGVAPQHTAPR
jgi:hypothetical protein